jgi:spore coat protein U-like protein
MGLPASAQTCSFSNTGLDFGNVALTDSSEPTTTGTFTATCSGTANQSVNICANIGAGSGGAGNSGSERDMKQGASALAFTLYTGASSSSTWGSYLWGFSPTPPSITVNLGADGTGSTSETINGLIYSNQGATGTGTFSTSFAGSDAQVDYGYASNFSCGSSLSGRATSVPFTVRTTNRSTCTVSATNLDFGSQGSLASDIDTTNSISLTCSSGTAYTVGLNNGNSGGTGPATRVMANTTNADTVTYGIYLDAGRTQAWGDGTTGSVASGTGNGSAQTFTGYGRIPAQPTPSAHDYTDTVVLTVTY